MEKKVKKELIKYIIFGVLTTIVNYFVYFTFIFLGVNYIVSNALAVISAILFAYITNKLYVFESNTTSVREKISEFFKFIGSRAFTGLIEMGLIIILVEILLLGSTVSKIAVSVLVVILNYIMSKIFVFKK